MPAEIVRIYLYSGRGSSKFVISSHQNKMAEMARAGGGKCGVWKLLTQSQGLMFWKNKKSRG